MYNVRYFIQFFGNKSYPILIAVIWQFFIIELMTRRFDNKTMKKVLCLILKPFDTLTDFGKEILD